MYGSASLIHREELVYLFLICLDKAILDSSHVPTQCVLYCECLGLDDLYGSHEATEPFDTWRNRFCGTVAVCDADRVVLGLEPPCAEVERTLRVVNPEPVRGQIDLGREVVPLVQIAARYIAPLCHRMPECYPIALLRVPRKDVPPQMDWISPVGIVHGPEPDFVGHVRRNIGNVIPDLILAPRPSGPHVYPVFIGTYP